MKYILSLTLLALLGVKAYDPELAMTSAFYSKTCGCAENDIAAWTCAPCQNNRVKGAIHNKVFTNTDNGGLTYVTYHPD
jgi:hypothetical protein